LVIAAPAVCRIGDLVPQRPLYGQTFLEERHANQTQDEC
jgi:hypothetical protein